MTSAILRVRFSVIRTLHVSVERAHIYLCGSCRELGSWNPDETPVRLCPSAPFDADEPSFWETSVDFPIGESGVINFDYKFVTRLLHPADGSVGPPEWEGCGAAQNRHFFWALTESSSAENSFFSYSTRPAHWRDSSPQGGEFAHTTRFYSRIAHAQRIHFTKVLDRVYLGTAPRQYYQLCMLRNMGVNVIFNLQTEHDIAKTSASLCLEQIDPRLEMTPAAERLRRVCGALGLMYVWLPTEDMSTEDRIRTVPQAVFVLLGLLASGHIVYVHCNAGVGRSAAVVGAYLMTGGMNFEDMQYFLASRRPCVYFDRVALDVAVEDFGRKFAAEVVEAMRAKLTIK